LERAEEMMTNERLIVLFDHYGLDTRDSLIEYLHEQVEYLKVKAATKLEAEPQEPTKYMSRDEFVSLSAEIGMQEAYRKLVRQIQRHAADMYGCKSDVSAPPEAAPKREAEPILWYYPKNRGIYLEIGVIEGKDRED
jgi:hypothetical protein